MLNTAESIAAMTAVGFALNAKTIYKNVSNVDLSLTIVDIDGLHKSLATQPTCQDMEKVADVHTLRLYYENKVIDSICS